MISYLTQIVKAAFVRLLHESQGMTMFLAVISFLLPLISAGQPGSHGSKGFEVGISAGYLLPSGKESQFLAAPPEPAFMEMIFSSPEIYSGIASQVNGELTGVGPYGEDKIVNFPSAGVMGAYRFNRSMSAFMGAQWQAGNHSRPFEITYFDPEMERVEVLEGEFQSARNVFDIQAGFQYITPGKTRFLFEAGPVISGHFYQEVEARAGDYQFEAAPAESSWQPGVYAAAGLVAMQSGHWRLDAKLSVKALFPDDNAIINPGVGIVFSYFTGRMDQKETVTRHISSLPEAAEISPGIYYPSYIRPIFDDHATTSEIPALDHTPVPYLQIESDPSDIIPGGLAYLDWYRFGNDWVIRQALWTWIENEIVHEDVVSMSVDVDNQTLFVNVPEDFSPGIYMLSLYYSSADGEAREYHLAIPVYNPDRQALLNEFNTDQWRNYYSTTDILREIWKRRDSLSAHRDSLRIAADSAWALRERAEKSASRLAAIDRYLDRLPGVVGPEVDDLLDSLDRMKEADPQILDTNALDNLVSGLQQAIDDCIRHSESLRKRRETLAEEIREMKNAQEKLMEQIHALFLANGFTGRYGFRNDGGYSLGYIGGEDANTDFGNLPWEKEVNKLKKELKTINGKYKEKLKELNELPGKITENEKKCEELQKQLEEARDLQAKADQMQAVKNQIRKECELVKALVNDLAKWCKANPEFCSFLKDLEDFLAEDCPQTPEEWNDFWKNYHELLQIKKKKEKELQDLVKEKDQELEEIDDSIEDDSGQIDSLWSDEIKIRNDEIRMLEEAKRQKQREEQTKKDEEAKLQKELTDCWEKLAKWIQDNSDKLDQENYEKLTSTLRTFAEAAGEGAGAATSKMALGGSKGEIVLSGLSAAFFNLLVSAAYAYMENRVTGVAKKVMDKLMKDRLAALAHLDKNRCGTFTMKDGTTYFYIKTGDKTLLFKISEDTGMTFEGEL